MVRRYLLLAVLLLSFAACLCLCACGTVPDEKPAEPEVTVQPTPAPTAEPTPEPVRVNILGAEYTDGDTFIDLSAMTDEDTQEVCRAIEKLSTVEEINLVGDDGYTSVSLDALASIRSCAPKAVLKCAFDVYGKYVTDETKEIRFTDTELGDACIERFRSLMPYLNGLELLRLEKCGIKDYDAMEQLKTDYPDKNIVWNIYMGGYSYMTDTTLVNTTLINDSNKYLTKYLHDVLYLDIGHDAKVSDIEFVRNFPKLQVIIISITRIADLTPLADCPDLEFLECFSSAVSDLTPLSGLKNLQYLNIGDCYNLDDLTPLYGMDSLVKVRICGRTRDHVSEAEILELIDNLPATCDVSYVGGHSANSGGWRFNPDGTKNERYTLLGEQMQYYIRYLDERASNSPSREVNDEND